MTTPAVLVVDDHPENLLALEAVLAPLGARITRAESGEEALRCVLADDFAAILLDVQMPGMDGFQTAELIKRRERTRHGEHPRAGHADRRLASRSPSSCS